MPSIYRLTPSLQMMNCLRIDSNVSNSGEVYDRDRTFFKKNPHRHTLIRHNAPCELDLELSTGRWLEAPALWLSVTRVSGDTHLVVAVYRGKQFWTDANTDADVAIVLVEMAKREGIDLREWVAFEDRVHAAEVQASATNVKVH